MSRRKGKLYVISGPSGTGKGTICAELLKDPFNDFSVSMTTRDPRFGEQEGVHYFFRTREEFEQTIANDGFLEYAEYNGNYYGTPIAPIQRWLYEGKNVILEIEVQGAEKVMDKRKDLVSIFLAVPSMKELERRLRGRGTETDEVIERRLAAAKQELTRVPHYQYVVLNDEVEQAVTRINTIIDAENLRYSRIDETILEVE